MSFMDSSEFVIKNPNIMGGTPVIRGTRVPVSTLFDYLMDGLTLEEFLDHFPTVQKADALAILEHSRYEALETAGSA
jgi:uncharacterized protein (DUF433 family)